MLSHRRLTLLIIPEEGGRTYEFKVPRAMVWVLSVSAAVIVFLLVGGLHAWLNASHLAKRVDSLERDRAILVEEVELIEELEAMMAQLESSNQQLRRITAEAVGLESAGPAAPAGRAHEQLITIADRLRYGRVRTVPSLAPVPFRSARPLDRGVLLPAPPGSLVRAAAAGRVERTGYERGQGLTLTVDLGNGVTVHYGGLSAVVAEEGEFVQKGQPVALTGKGPDGGTPGVRFTVYENGRDRTADYQPLWL